MVQLERIAELFAATKSPVFVELEGISIANGVVVSISGSKARLIITAKFGASNFTATIRGGASAFVKADYPGASGEKYLLPEEFDVGGGANDSKHLFVFSLAPPNVMGSGADDDAIIVQARRFLEKALFANIAAHLATLKTRKLAGPARRHVERELGVLQQLRVHNPI